LRGGVELARELAATSACRAAGIGVEVLPGGAGRTIEHIRQRADTAFHPVGTCRLGDDAGAVVDPWLRVVGVSGLRVVDASVMPTTVAGNAQAAVFAIAERAPTHPRRLLMNRDDVPTISGESQVSAQPRHLIQC
jgi:choline dehydrogenase-like flavoprotein